MRDTVFLIISSQGISRMRKQYSELRSNEIAVRVEVEVADGIFDDLCPTATLHIEEDHILRPPVDVRLTGPSHDQ